MLKYWLALLLLLNAAVLAWQFDAFAPWGWGPNSDRQPDRLQQQINPDALKFGLPGSAESVKSAESPDPASDTAAPVSPPTDTVPPVAAIPAAEAVKAVPPVANPTPTSPTTQVNVPTPPAPAPAPANAVPAVPSVPR